MHRCVFTQTEPDSDRSVGSEELEIEALAQLRTVIRLVELIAIMSYSVLSFTTEVFKES